MHDRTSVKACRFDAAPGRWVCSACGRIVRLDSDKPPTAVCRGPRGLGDMVADGLAAVGITKERVTKAVGRDCGCSKRQAALNAIGEKIGLPPGRSEAI